MNVETSCTPECALIRFNDARAMALSAGSTDERRYWIKMARKWHKYLVKLEVNYAE